MDSCLNLQPGGRSTCAEMGEAVQSDKRFRRENRFDLDQSCTLGEKLPGCRLRLTLRPLSILTSRLILPAQDMLLNLTHRSPG